jgi:hypothetical protein
MTDAYRSIKPQGIRACAKFARLSLYRQSEGLINLGAYVSGSNPRLDSAIKSRTRIMRFLRQGARDVCTVEDTIRADGGAGRNGRRRRSANAFRFRLEQSPRRRATQVDLEKSQAAVAANRLAAIRADVESRRKELKDGALKMAAGATGSVLACWARGPIRTRRDYRTRGADAASGRGESEKAGTRQP